MDTQDLALVTLTAHALPAAIQMSLQHVAAPVLVDGGRQQRVALQLNKEQAAKIAVDIAVTTLNELKARLQA